MRILIKASIPTEIGNAKAKDGSLGGDIQKIMAEQKPETAYFIEENGQRTAILVVNITNSDEIPKFAEPWFLAFNAEIEFHPAMAPEDLAKAAPAIAAAAKSYG